MKKEHAFFSSGRGSESPTIGHGNVLTVGYPFRTGIYNETDDFPGLNISKEEFEKALPSLSLAPITLGHHFVFPEEDSNDSQYIVGNMLDDVESEELDGETYAKVSALVTVSKAVGKMATGSKELSIGFGFVPVFPDNKKKPIELTEIDINHVSIEPEGAAGEKARLIFSKDSKLFRQDQKKEKKHMEKVTINGVEFECSPELKSAFSVFSTEAKKNEGLVAGLTDEVKGLKKSAKETDDSFDGKVNERVVLIDTFTSKAKQINPEFSYDASKSLEEQKRELIQMAKPDMKLENKDKSFVDGVFESIDIVTDDDSDTGEFKKDEKVQPVKWGDRSSKKEEK